MVKISLCCFTKRLDEQKGPAWYKKLFKKVMQKRKLDLNKMEDEKSFGKLNSKEIGSK